MEEVGDSVDFVVGVFFGGLGEAVFLSAVAEAGGGHVEAAGGCDFGVEFVAYGEDLPGEEGQEGGGTPEGGVFEGMLTVVVEDEGSPGFIEEGVQTEEVDFPALAVWTASGDQGEPIAPSPEFGEGFRDVGKGGDGLDFAAVVGLKGAFYM